MFGSTYLESAHWSIFYLYSLAFIDPGLWNYTEPYPLLKSTIGVEWTFQNENDVISQLNDNHLVNPLELHYQAYAESSADKKRCSTYFVAAGPGEGKSRFLTGNPFFLAKLGRVVSFIYQRFSRIPTNCKKQHDRPSEGAFA